MPSTFPVGKTGRIRGRDTIGLEVLADDDPPHLPLTKTVLGRGGRGVMVLGMGGRGYAPECSAGESL